MRITVDGKHCEISTKKNCNPDNWNVSAGRLQGKSEAVREFNSYLDTLQQKVFEAKRKIIEMDKELTAESIKNELLGKTISRSICCWKSSNTTINKWPH